MMEVVDSIFKNAIKHLTISIDIILIMTKEDLNLWRFIKLRACFLTL